jgi:hypothetical protein
VLAVCGGQRALGKVGNGPQRSRAHPSLDRPQLLERRVGQLELATRRPRPHEQLERRSASQAGVPPRLAEHALGELRRAAGLAQVERQPGAAQLGAAGGRRTLEQRLRLPRPSLPAPELGQPDQRASRPGRAGAREVLDRGLQHRLGLWPAAAPEVHGAVLGPAEGQHVAAPVALRELRDPVAPRKGALVVEHGDAGRDEEAAGPGARDRDRRLSLERRRRGLVEAAHPILHLHPRHQARPLEGEPEHLQVRHSEPLAQRGRAAGQLGGPDAVAARVEQVASMNASQP